MTLHLTIAVDPGASGAIAVLADGIPMRVFDMPVSTRKAGGQEVNASGLVIELRSALRDHVGAQAQGVIEQVSAMPGQGVSSMFRFGESFGIVKGVFATLGIGYKLVTPQAWKKHHGLIGTDKDTARTLAIQTWPESAHLLARKRDGGRADAMLLGAYAYDNELFSKRGE